MVFPKMSPAVRRGYHKLKFSAGSWPIVTAAATVERRGEGDRFRVALGASTAVPVLSEALLPTGASADDLRAFATSCASMIANVGGVR